jgi:hypothetical protein
MEMATAKKKSPAPKGGAKAKSPGTKKAEVPGKGRASAEALVKPKGGGKGLLIAGVMFVALIALGLEIFSTAKKQAALKFDMVRTGKNIPQGMAAGQGQSPQGLQGDKDDDLFYLEGMGADLPRLQKFNAQVDLVGAYKPKKASEMLTGAVDIDVDQDGGPWILLKNGDIQVLDKDLNFVKTVSSHVNGPSGIGLGPDGRIYVSSQSENKVVMLNQEGIRAGEFGAPGTKTGDLASPVRMRVTQDGLIAIMELGSTGLHMKVFGQDLKLKTQFDLSKLSWGEPVRLGVNAEDRMFVNDPIGGRGLVMYDLKSGDFLGESQGTNDNQLFISPGACGANKYSSTVYVHTISGLIHCRMPVAGDKK